MLAKEGDDVRAVGAGVLLDEVLRLVEDLAGEVRNPEGAPRVARRAAEGRVAPAGRSNGLYNLHAAAAAGAGVEAAPGAVADHAEDSGHAAGLSLQQRQRRQRAGGHDEALPLAVAVQAFRSVLLGLAEEDLPVEELLDALVAVVNQQLLESVRAEDLEAIQVQQAQALAFYPLRGRHPAGDDARDPAEEGGVQLLRERRAQGLGLVLPAAAHHALCAGGPDGRLHPREEVLQALRRCTDELLHGLAQLRGANRLVREHTHGSHHARDLGDLRVAHARAQQALIKGLEVGQTLLVRGSRGQARGLCQAGASRLSDPLPGGRLQHHLPEGPRRRRPADQGAEGRAQLVEDVVGALRVRQEARDARGLEHVRPQRHPSEDASIGEVHLDELAEAR
mmetsp:Transcript_50733/g.130742  ORF Transcript_50733/g.130742 Transcript_50733/m.130742 type:complete len:393 (+) Transcript_50733:770-1948(+)